MKIGVISDTHGCAERWTLAYEKFFKDADLIVHAGDVLYHGPRNPLLSDYNPAKLAEALNACPIPILIAKGNCDSEVDAMVLDLPVEAPYGYAMIQKFRILATHGHCLGEEEKHALAKRFKADLFVTGHTHVAEVHKEGRTFFLNPGSPSMSKRNDQRATVAVVDDEKVAIIDIDTGHIVASISR